LPHIVLNKRSLPWERCVFKTDGAPDRAMPWMALVVLDACEILPPRVGSNKEGQEPNPTGVTSLTIAELTAPEDGVLTGQYKLDSIDEGDRKANCQVIDIAPGTFQAVMPRREELRYLVHCRQVTVDRKAIPGPDRPGSQPPVGNGMAWYAVVVAGRFPSQPPIEEQTGELKVVHLVSLEGFDSYLNEPGTLKPDTDRIRLVSLASWTFTCLPEKGESFSELMRGLAGEGLESHQFRLPVTAAGSSETHQYTTGMLAAGYVPRSYHTRQGEVTFGWYRGPFTPQLVPRLPPDRQPFTSAAQAMVYDPEHGLFDLSYAVAWEMGRLLALSDQRFGIRLQERRRKAHRQIDLLQERTGIRLPPMPMTAPRGTGGFQALLEKDLVSTSFMRHLVGDFAREIEPLIFELDEGKPSKSRPEPNAPQNTFAPLAATHRESDVQKFLKAPDDEEIAPICEWLAHLYLLYGVPFNNLVAHERLLPPETVRFFYLDRNWLQMLLEGALSTGVNSSRDTTYQNLMADAIYKGVEARVKTMRDRLLGIHTDADDDLSQGPMAGLLVRSAVVAGWPGLEVRAYRHNHGDQGSVPIGLLRMDRLSSDVLLCLFPTVPTQIEFNEPKEGLYFGLEVENGTEEIVLRNVSGDQAGKLCEPHERLKPERIHHRRLDILKLLDSLEGKKGKLGLGAEDALGPAAFALQMVKVPQQMVFRTNDQS
jgi:hypothetical protein